MRTLPRLLIFVGLAWLTIVLFSHARTANSQENIDATRVVMLFGGVILVGGLAGILFVIMVLPSIGDMIGNFFFQPNQQVTKTPHADAQAAVARGDYEDAVAEYRKVIEKDPADTLAYSEIAKISCEHLEDPLAASAILEQALRQEWSQEDAAFLSARLVDVYWDHQRDARSARALLMQVIENMAGTRHSANAEHRLKELEQQVLMEPLEPLEPDELNAPPPGEPEPPPPRE
jgi:tetratricopeptide (TPR) repeat protein